MFQKQAFQSLIAALLFLVRMLLVMSPLFIISLLIIFFTAGREGIDFFIGWAIAIYLFSILMNWLIHWYQVSTIVEGSLKYQDFLSKQEQTLSCKKSLEEVFQLCVQNGSFNSVRRKGSRISFNTPMNLFSFGTRVDIIFFDQTSDSEHTYQVRTRPRFGPGLQPIDFGESLRILNRTKLLLQ
jgi:hypothetical protein